MELLSIEHPDDPISPQEQNESPNDSPDEVVHISYDPAIDDRRDKIMKMLTGNKTGKEGYEGDSNPTEVKIKLDEEGAFRIMEAVRALGVLSSEMEPEEIFQGYDLNDILAIDAQVREALKCLENEEFSSITTQSDSTEEYIPYLIEIMGEIGKIIASSKGHFFL